MSEQNKQTAIRFMQALGSGAADTVKSLMAPGFQATAMGSSCLAGTRGFDDVVAGVAIFTRISKGGVQFTVLHATAEDNRVSLELQGTCELVNGKAYNNQYHMLFLFDGDKIVAMKEYFNDKLVDDVLGPLFAG